MKTELQPGVLVRFNIPVTQGDWLQNGVSGRVLQYCGNKLYYVKTFPEGRKLIVNEDNLVVSNETDGD